MSAPRPYTLVCTNAPKRVIATVTKVGDSGCGGEWGLPAVGVGHSRGLLGLPAALPRTPGEEDAGVADVTELIAIVEEALSLLMAVVARLEWLAAPTP